MRIEKRDFTVVYFFLLYWKYIFYTFSPGYSQPPTTSPAPGTPGQPPHNPGQQPAYNYPGMSQLLLTLLDPLSVMAFPFVIDVLHDLAQLFSLITSVQLYL